MRLRLEKEEVDCNACGAKAKYLGKLVKTEGLFALPNPGDLYHCQVCGLYFRHPYLSVYELKSIYSNLKADLWKDGEDRQDFNVAFAEIKKRIHTGKVLDIGCFRGDFLLSLGSGYEKHGVELSFEAAKMAIQRGVDLVVPEIDDVKLASVKYDVITMIDVIEHLVDPVSFLQQIWEMLEQSGILIIATGNTDALTWRFLRLDYWYYWPEHVCFFNPRWFNWIASKLGGNVLHITKYAHFKGSRREKLEQLSRAIIFSFTAKRSGDRFIDRCLDRLYWHTGLRRNVMAPSCHRWNDHILIVLAKC